MAQAAKAARMGRTPVSQWGYSAGSKRGAPSVGRASVSDSQAYAGTFASAMALKSSSMRLVWRSNQPLVMISLMKPGTLPGMS